MVNITHPELSETKSQTLPPASLEALKQMREEMCSISASRDFKLQPNQRFLRRVMSPESPTRNILLVHGTGVGKTCTAIQIAEEYMIRPEFQDKRVFVLANPSIQENFKQQIFDISKVTLDPDGLLLSKQCTGRRYLDMLHRSQSEPLRYSDKASQAKIMSAASKLIGEFYEFQGYAEFANVVDKQKLAVKSQNEMNKWIHDTFDNRLIIVDEAHNLRETTESDTTKLSSIAIEQILKIADGITIVLLTATPMYDSYDELLYYFNLFLWNDRRQDPKASVKPSDIFTEDGQFREGAEVKFRGWCQDYISFVRGENPFTFPFRLPPPDNLVAPIDRETDILGNAIRTPRKYLTLTKSNVSPLQAEAIKGLTVKAISDPKLLCVYPDNKTFRESFDNTENGFKYKSVDFLAPSKVALYSSKFGLIMNMLSSTEGIVFVYSNLVESGAQLFAMCLEEHGFAPAIGNALMKDTSNEIARGTAGKYVLLTSDISQSDIKKVLVRLRSSTNINGSDIRVIIASPKVSEGVDFRFVRQVHVLDPWFNMSRVEQILGRGMRTCSHSLLPFEEQNCTVYLHICRFSDSTQETLDEFIYRTFVEAKALKIAKIKRVVMESAMDCPLQQDINSLPADWRGEPNAEGKRFTIPQIRAQDRQRLELTISQMSAPTFLDEHQSLVCNLKEAVVDPDHIRPLSAYVDVRDEIFDKILKLFAKKPVWSNKDLYEKLKQYSNDVLSYNLQDAIDSGFHLKDKQGRIGLLQAKDGLFAFTVGENDTAFERLVMPEKGQHVELPIIEAKEEVKQEVVVETVNLDAKREAYAWPPHIKERFSTEILDWYLADMILSPEEKIDLLLKINWEDPPMYAEPLKAQVGDITLYVLGSKQIYNAAKEKIDPVGAEQDTYKSWLTAAKDRFIAKKEEIFGSVKEQGIIFNVDEKSVEIRKAARSKTIGGRMCTTYTEAVLNSFAKWLNDEPFPEKVKTKKDRCLYLDLLVREAVSNKKEGLFWLTPEELQIFNEDENRADLLKRIK